MITIQEAIKKIIAKRALSTTEMQTVMTQIMSGNATDAQIGGFLVGLASKGEAVSEIIGATRVMRKLATPIKLKNKQYLVDTCGTGGDGSGLFNISTASAFVAAAAGVKVAKHGNRCISSKSGSADVLELAGADINLSPEAIAKSITKIGVGFMFAPAHHSAMKYAIGARKELAVRTIFNILGPLTNPASAPNQVLGVYSKNLLAPIAQTLLELGANHVLVVHSQDGLDEISSNKPSDIAELKSKKISYYTIEPAQFDIKPRPLDSIKVNNATQSLKLMQQALNGKPSSAYDIVALNAGAAIYVGGISTNLKSGVYKAKQVLDSGIAYQKFNDFIHQNIKN